MQKNDSEYHNSYYAEDVYSKIKQRADKMTQEFKDRFYKEFEVSPYVHFNIKHLTIAFFDLDVICEIVNETISEKVLEKYPEGVLSRSRKMEIAANRQMIFKLAHDIGYSKSSIARHFKCNHATVIHGYNKIESLLEVGDRTFVELYNNLVNVFRKRKSMDEIKEKLVKA